MDVFSDDRTVAVDDVAHLSLFEGKYRPFQASGLLPTARTRKETFLALSSRTCL
jgi:hypothetical protein